MVLVGFVVVGSSGGGMWTTAQRLVFEGRNLRAVDERRL